LTLVSEYGSTAASTAVFQGVSSKTVLCRVLAKCRPVVDDVSPSDMCAAPGRIVDAQRRLSVGGTSLAAAVASGVGVWAWALAAGGEPSSLLYYFFGMQVVPARTAQRGVRFSGTPEASAELNTEYRVDRVISQRIPGAEEAEGRTVLWSMLSTDRVACCSMGHSPLQAVAGCFLHW